MVEDSWTYLNCDLNCDQNLVVKIQKSSEIQNEAVDVFKNLENIELSTTYKDGTLNNYNERNFTARTKAASSLNIAGVQQYDWWAALHPFSQKPVVGAILVWQPSFALIDESNESDNYDYLDF